MKPFLGRTWPDLVSLILKTGFHCFEAPCGINGLCKETNPQRLEVLAVIADRPGNGHFREFVRLCQENYSEVCFWHEFNPVLGDALKRYGFKAHSEPWENEVLKGYRWRRNDFVQKQDQLTIK